MEIKRKEINRKELYQKVWEKPMTKLAQEYGISDVGLKKICKHLNVPTPPRGYWAKVQNNIRVDKVPLPKIKSSDPTAYTIQKSDNPDLQLEKNVHDFSDEALELIDKITSANPIKVPVSLNSPHPFVVETKKILSKSYINRYGILERNYEKRVLDIRVSPKMLNRALRIFNSIIKFCEKQNIEFSIAVGSYSRKTHINLFGENVSFFLREPSKQRKHELTKEDEDYIKKWRHLYDPQKYDYLPTGKLSLEIDSYRTFGFQKLWNDGKNRAVEEQIKDFVIGVIKIADIDRTKRLKEEEERRLWEEEQARRAELERLRKIEEQRLRDLEHQAEMWTKSKQLREYIKEVETSFPLNELSEESKIKFMEWTKWAKAHAERLDPLSKGRPFERDLNEE